MTKFCANCGAAMEDHEGFCPSCGANQQGFAANNMRCDRSGVFVGAYKKKSAGIAALLSFIIIGVGQLYIGKIGLGLLLMLSSFITAAAAITVFFGVMSQDFVPGAILILVIFGAVELVLWLYSIFDAYKGANTYNEILVESGHPPW